MKTVKSAHDPTQWHFINGPQHEQDAKRMVCLSLREGRIWACGNYTERVQFECHSPKCSFQDMENA